MALFYWIAGACGLATGVVGAAFHLAVDHLLRWPDWLVDRMGAGPLTIAAGAGIAALGVTLAFVLTRYLAPETAGSGVPEVEGALEGMREVRWRRVLPVKFLGGVLGLSSGLVGGREGPTIHIGASIGAALAEWLRLDKMDYHALLAAGAAAGPGGCLQRAARCRAVRHRGDAQAVPLHLPLLCRRDRGLGRQRLRHGAGGRRRAAASHRHRRPAAGPAADLHAAGRRARRAGAGLQQDAGDGARLARQGFRARARSSIPSSSARPSACSPSSCRWRSAAARR